MTKQIEQERIEEFLSRLTVLCREYEILIGGCGCCGSPFLEHTPEEEFEGKRFTVVCSTLHHPGYPESYNYENLALGRSEK